MADDRSQICHRRSRPGDRIHCEVRVGRDVDLRPTDTKRTKELERKVERLEAKLAKKDHVIAQISEE